MDTDQLARIIAECREVQARTEQARASMRALMKIAGQDEGETHAPVRDPDKAADSHAEPLTAE